jgi:GT2 family glycosyltransferase
MAARKKQTALYACGKRLERGLRRLRYGLRDARAVARLLWSARLVDAKELKRLAAGLVAPDVIICGGAGPSAAADCRRCLDALERGLLPPRQVWIIAAADALAAVRSGVGPAVPAARGRSPHLHFVEDPSSCGQSSLPGLKAAVAAATSRHVVLCDAGANVCDDALLWIAATLEPHGGREPRAVYGDDGVADPAASPWTGPLLDHKPGFSWTALLSGSALGPVVAFARTTAAAAIDRLVGRGVTTRSTGESLYAVSLEALYGLSHDDVAHVPHPLAIRRGGDAAEDTARIAHDALAAMGVSATVSPDPRAPTLHRFDLHPRRSPRVSIIIPTKNAGAMVRSCVRDLRDHAGYGNYDVTVIDHDSDEPELLGFLADESAAGRLRVFPYRGPFNFAAMNNAAVRSTGGSLLLFLNNDVDRFSPRWLEQMAATFELDDRIAAVGGLLSYPDGSIQHAGVVLNAKRMCQHAHVYWPGDALGYGGRIRRLQEFSAVTAALMLVRRDAFEEVGGFDEQFPDDYNDIDLCLRLRAAGYAVVYQPHVSAMHWEGRTRTVKETAKDIFIARWGHAFAHDPFYHPHLAPTEFRADGLERYWRQRKAVALAGLLAGRAAAGDGLAESSRRRGRAA